jgi:hypothetical protein
MSRYVDISKLEMPEDDCCYADLEAFVETICESEYIDIVRCGECKYWQDNNGGYPHPDCRWVRIETPDADDYCSLGERKEGRQE